MPKELVKSLEQVIVEFLVKLGILGILGSESVPTFIGGASSTTTVSSTAVP